MPRPRILTEAKQLEICALVHAGCTLAAAARYVGCSVLTIQREARRNPEFRAKIRQRRMSAEMGPLHTLHLAAAGNWRAAAWLLERTQPQHYGKRAANSFGPAELAELVGRFCQIVGQEIRDAKKLSRIERRVMAAAREKIVGQDDNPFRPQLPAPTPPPANEAEAESATCVDAPAEPPASSSESTEPHQNPTDTEPVLICLADVPPGNSRRFAAADASK